MRTLFREFPQMAHLNDFMRITLMPPMKRSGLKMLPLTKLNGRRDRNFMRYKNFRLREKLLREKLNREISYVKQVRCEPKERQRLLS